MKFGYTILYVNDVEATVQFYEKAFGLQRRMVVDDKTYGELETGNTRLAFAAAHFVRTLIPVEFSESGADRQPAPVEIGLCTDDVAGAYRQAVAAGAVAVKEPAQKPWGQIVGYVRDLNGYLVELCTPMP